MKGNRVRWANTVLTQSDRTSAKVVMSRARETAQALEPSIVWNVTKATPKTRPKDVETSTNARRLMFVPLGHTAVIQLVHTNANYATRRVSSIALDLVTRPAKLADTAMRW